MSARDDPQLDELREEQSVANQDEGMGHVVNMVERVEQVQLSLAIIRPQT